MNKKIRLTIIIMIYLLSFLSVVYLVVNFSRSAEDYLTPVSKIEFSHKDQSLYMKDGFSEPDGDQRWSNKNYSLINVPLIEKKEYVIEANIKAYPEKDRVQAIKLTVNDQYIGEQIVNNFIDYQSYSFIVPKEYVKKINHIKFEYNFTVVDAEHNNNEVAVSYKYLIFREEE
ncbi:hypothetical protein [Paenibacillus durus]|uniref:Uncharacterized protein n=1 Tax=Paenibacillus durus TaxID=44251 RepID=A0A089J0M5_PAEDU|nr:hypothetical protein [Paenibacillus durus]AIQ14744.1 hypothetical protein PDUR_24855 [Paenibacillus durus]